MSTSLSSVSLKEEFRALNSSGFSVSTVNLRVKAQLNDDMVAKVAFALPKKEFRRAVDRNKVKRRCRSALHDIAKCDRLVGGLYLIGGRRTLLELSYNDILGELRYLLEKIYDSRSLERKS